MKITTIIWLLLIAVCSSKAQAPLVEVYRTAALPVIIDGQPLVNAWAGGLNSAQFSTIDLNFDGKEDLFVFDRISNRISTYINTSTGPGEISYIHDYSFTGAFPDTLQGWVLLRDYNCDGKKDIFTNTSSGLRIYKNVGNAQDGLHFELRSNLTKASYDFSGNPFSAPIYTIGIDIPSIVDYDNDGDLDIFSFTELSSTVYYYKNRAMEIGNCDSLAYVCGNRCYGMFSESVESFSITKEPEFICDFNVIEPRGVHADLPNGHNEGPLRHTGGTLLSIDLDQNGIKDLILSDITETYMTALRMLKSVNNLDSVAYCHFDFPAPFQNTQAVEMSIFPAGFYEDVDNDGIRDLLVSPNAFASALDKNSVWYYKNHGLNDLPDFHFVQHDFLQETMIDLGSGAFPVVWDENADGLPDLLVANDEYYSDTEPYTSRIWLFRNTGTSTQPAFTLVNDNWLDIPSLQWKTVYPAFGDLDGDGDDDLVMGNRDGVLHFFRNTAGAGNPAQFVLEQSPMLNNLGQGIDVGIRATPQLVDLSNDGLLDLAVGERNGNINYFRNTGTSDNYEYTLIKDTLGSVLATNILGIYGNSVPFFFKDDAGHWQLLLGTETGHINQYTDIEDNMNGTFTLVTLKAGNVREGQYSAVAYVDINADGRRDLFYGNRCGGLAYYDGDSHVGIAQSKDTFNWSLYPNPAADEVNISIGHFGAMTKVPVRIYDLYGRVVWQAELNQGKHTLSLRGWADGLYVVQVHNAGAKRLVKK